MESILGVTQPFLTHISHIETLRPERGHTLNPGSHQKQGAKALREPQKAQEAGAAELNRRQEPHGQRNQEGFLEEGAGTNLEWKSEVSSWQRENRK